MNVALRASVAVRTGVVLLAVALAAGCAKTRYRVVAPAELRGPVAAGAGARLTRDNVEYEVFQSGEQAVIYYANRTGAPLRLSGESTMVDATGRSFSVEPQEIAPDQSGRLLVPPVFAAERGAVERRPVASQVQVGGFDDGGIVTPRTRYEGGDRVNREAMRGFRWPDGRTARFRLTFEPAPSTPTTAPTAEATNVAAVDAGSADAVSADAASQPAGFTHEFVLSRGR